MKYIVRSVGARFTGCISSLNFSNGVPLIATGRSDAKEYDSWDDAEQARLLVQLEGAVWEIVEA